jgi:hypothetical protein
MIGNDTGGLEMIGSHPPPVVWNTPAEAEDEMNEYLNRDSSSNSSEQPVQPSAGEQAPQASPQAAVEVMPLPAEDEEEEKDEHKGVGSDEQSCKRPRLD